MATPLDRLPASPDATDPTPWASADLREVAATDLGDWGYEAADPALQARLWGEAAFRFEDR